MPQKTKMTPDQVKELRTAAKATAKKVRGEFKQVAADLAKAACVLYHAGLEKEARDLQTRSHHFAASVVADQRFMEVWAEWAFENPGQAYRDVSTFGTKNIKLEADVNHKHFVITNLEDPGSWEKKVVDVSSTAEVLPWEKE